MSRYHRTHRFLLGVGLAAVLASLGCRTNPDVAKEEYRKSGDRYFDQKQYAEAIVQYRNALQQDPKFGEVRYKLAQAYSKRGDNQNAYREYIRAADLLPDNVQAQVDAAALLLLTRQYEDAKTRVQKALAKDPKNVQAQTILRNSLAGLNDFDGAVKQLEEANKLEPTAGAYAGIGVVESARGAHPDAEKAFRTAVGVEPKNVGAHQALALEPNNDLANRALVALYIGTNRAREAEPFLKRLAENDKTPQASYKIGLGEFFARTNRLSDALKILAPLAAQKEAYAPSQTRVAAIQFAQGERVLAYQTIGAVLQREPKNEPALLTKTRFQLAERKLDDALKTAQAASAANPQSVEAFFLIGVTQRARRQPVEAIAAFNEVIKLNPRAVAAQLQLSELNLAAGKRDVGLQLAEEVAKSAPGAPVVQLNLARNLIAGN